MSKTSRSASQDTCDCRSLSASQSRLLRLVFDTVALQVAKDSAYFFSASFSFSFSFFFSGPLPSGFAPKVRLEAAILPSSIGLA